MRLEIVGPTYKLNKDVLKRVAKAAFSYLGISSNKGSIELKFVAEKVIRSLNREYRGLDKPTDVLSFNICDDPLAGQIVICYTYTVSQAKERGRKIEDEFPLLLTHGILHILGYDHTGEDDTAKMQRAEEKILKSEGIRC